MLPQLRPRNGSSGKRPVGSTRFPGELPISAEGKKSFALHDPITTFQLGIGHKMLQESYVLTAALQSSLPQSPSATVQRLGFLTRERCTGADFGFRHPALGHGCHNICYLTKPMSRKKSSTARRCEEASQQKPRRASLKVPISTLESQQFAIARNQNPKAIKRDRFVACQVCWTPRLCPA